MANGTTRIQCMVILHVEPKKKNYTSNWYSLLLFTQS